MGMRDWLIIMVIVGIILILIDGYRRKRKDSIRLKIDKNIPPHDSDLEAAVELPNGGARVIPRDDNFDDDEDYDADGYQDYDDESDDDQIVPVLMDAVSIDKELTKQELFIDSEESVDEREEELEETIQADSTEAESTQADSAWDSEEAIKDDLDDVNNEEDYAKPLSENYEETDDFDEKEDEGAEENYLEEDHQEEYFQKESPEDTDPEFEDTSADEDYAELADNEDISPVRVSNREEERLASKDRIEPTLGAMSGFSDAELDDRPARASSTTKSKKQDKTLDHASDSIQAELFAESPEDFIQAEEEHDESDESFLEPEEVIVINVMAKQGELFAGSDLLPILLQHDMRLGKMSIFHKHADSSDNGPVVYSMANMVKPGTFDVTQMEEFSTPGVSFFLQLPNAFGNMKSFEQMLSAADSIKESLNGDLKDEHRSVITRQTIEHCRQRIQDFELAQLSKK